MSGIIKEKTFLGAAIAYKVGTKAGVYDVHENNDGLNEYNIGDKVFLSIVSKGRIEK